jgi:threonine dehydrogenase-like Zn-dependent dehydrogenase
MKALVNTTPGQLELKEWPMPEPGPDQVRIRTGACGICATDLDMISGWLRTSCPAIPGHEWAGTIDAVGPGVDAALIGLRCVADNVLADGGEVGFEHPGGYAQYFLTEASNVLALPANFSLAVATQIELLAVCVRALRRLRLESRESALILGDGPTGMLMLVLLKAEGVEKITFVGGRSARLDLARQFGATTILNYHEVGNDLAGAIAASPDAPFSNVIEATASPAAMQTCIDVTAPAGKIVMIGEHGDEGRASFVWNRVLHKELEIIGSNASAGAWPRAVELAVSGKVPLERIISKRLPAASGVEAVQLVRESRDLIKVVLEW